jgi:hypothetical protein
MAAPGFPPFVRSPLQLSTQQRLLDLITSFAAAGVPTTTATAVPEAAAAGAVSVSWRPVDAKGEYLDVGASLAMKRESEFERQIRFWNRIKGEQRGRESKLSDRPVSELFTRIAVRRI